MVFYPSYKKAYKSAKREKFFLIVKTKPPSWTKPVHNTKHKQVVSQHFIMKTIINSHFMKTLRTKLALLLSLGIFFSFSSQAQKISVTTHFSKFRINQIESPSGDIDYEGSSTVGLDLRLFTKKKWAFRAGLALDNLNYEVQDGLQLDYVGRRQDIRGEIGLEKHFLLLGKRLDIYPGIYIPITVTGEDVIADNLYSFRNGDMRAGLGLNLGANLRLLKILRLGVEFDVTYDNFSSKLGQSAEEFSLAPFRGLNYGTALTLGVAF